jgi:L-alanine-DL-glutamate epimerase-like enolase superfamily enzyme
MKIERIETLACDAGWRNYHFLKLVTDDGIVGWSEFDEAFGPPGSRPSSSGMLTV